MILTTVLAGLPGEAVAQRTSWGDSLTITIERGLERIEAGEPARAISEFRHAQGLLGLVLVYGGDDEFLYRESALIYRGLAEAYLTIGEPHAAAVEASRGVNIVEDDVRMWTVLGQASYRMANIDEASMAFERALEIDPDQAEAHWGLALVAVARNRLDQARDHGIQALRLSSRPRYALGLARWSAVKGAFGEAASWLDRYEQLTGVDSSDAGVVGLRSLYRQFAREGANRIDPSVTRLQVNFDLKPGDEIPYVPVSFNGHDPAYILFDTGADLNVIDAGYARRIGVETRYAGGKLHGAYRSSPSGYTVLDNLALGSVTIRDIPFSVGDLRALGLRSEGSWRIAAVINPAWVFRDFLVILDYYHRRIELIRYDAGGAAYAERRSRLRKTATPFLFDANAVWPIFRVSLDGNRNLPFLADTGASDLLIDREVASALMLDPDGFVATAGGHSREDLRAILLDQVPRPVDGIALRGILGFPFFRGMRVAFDYRDMMLVIEN